MELLCGVIEDALDKDGIFASGVRGGSMKPMLRPGRDTVYITKPDRVPKKYDLIVYKTDSGYTLHRIVGQRKGVYLVRGDNTYRTERVSSERVIGVFDGFLRRGRYYAAAARSYRLYARLWVALYPVRYPLWRLYSFFRR